MEGNGGEKSGLRIVEAVVSRIFWRPETPPILPASLERVGRILLLEVATEEGRREWLHAIERVAN